MAVWSCYVFQKIPDPIRMKDPKRVFSLVLNQNPEHQHTILLSALPETYLHGREWDG
jgi:hypothetical protein